jgi:hypothetical protein
MGLPLTNELLSRAMLKLAKAEQTLQANPTSKWLQMFVQVERDKVEAIRQSLSKSELH